MDNPTSDDLEMIHELLARMQENPGQPYDDVDDDDDDDYDDDDDDDDDEEGFYGEQSIQTLLNPYGGSGVEDDMESAGGQMPNMQTMNFLQGLLNMGNSSIPGMAEIEAAIGGSMGGMASPMEGANGFLPTMQSLIPNMSNDVAGVLAGAFGGGMGGALMDYGGHGGATIEDYDDDDDDEEDDDDDDDEDDALSDEEDEEDDEDDEEDIKHHRQIDASDVALGAVGAVGGLMAAGLFANNHQQRFQEPSYSSQGQHALMPPPTSVPQHHRPSIASLAAPLGFMLPSAAAAVASALSPSSHQAPHPNSHQLSRSSSQSLTHPSSHPMGHPGTHPMGHPGAHPMGHSIPHPMGHSVSHPMGHSVSHHMGHSVPKPMGHQITRSSTHLPSSNYSASQTPVSSQALSQVTITSIAPSLGGSSGGTVVKADPFAALMTGTAGVPAEIGFAPVMSNLLGNSGGTTMVNKLSPPPSSPSVIGTNGRSLTDNGSMEGLTSALALSKISSTPNSIPSNHPKSTMIKAQTTDSQLQATLEKSKSKKLKEECEDDKASLDSGMGKSDTESVGKKTPSPPPSSSTGQEVGSCASIPDLASATESMRDSDTDNHSEVHNVTANLSDLDNDVHDHKSVPVQQYASGNQHIFIEHPTYGWSSLVGLDTAKEALKNLFNATSFPSVFEGTEGTCKGILLFGPSSSGKTNLATALAKESNNAVLVGISSSYLLTRSPLDAVHHVKCIFEQARRHKPAVILFDEIEALSYHPNNESAISAKNEILAQTRGLTTLQHHPAYPPRQDTLSNNDNILVLGTTNQPWLLEERMRRVFTYNIHVKLPGEKPRHELYRRFLQTFHHNITEEQFDCLVLRSEGYSAVDINYVIGQASHRMIPHETQESAPGHITFENICSVMNQHRCRYNSELQQRYREYITAATHRADNVEDNSKNKKDKQKGVKKFSHRIAKSLAVAVLSVID